MTTQDLNKLGYKELMQCSKPLLCDYIVELREYVAVLDKDAESVIHIVPRVQKIDENGNVEGIGVDNILPEAKKKIASIREGGALHLRSRVEYDEGTVEPAVLDNPPKILKPEPVPENVPDNSGLDHVMDAPQIKAMQIAGEEPQIRTLGKKKKNKKKKK